MIDALTVLIAGVAALAAVGSVYLAWRLLLAQQRNSHFELARTLHADLTSGEVATARALLGTLVHGTAEARSVVDRDAARDAYFTLLWSFERVEAGRRVILEVARGTPHEDSPVTFLDTLVAWHVQEWGVARPITDGGETRTGIATAKARIESLFPGEEIKDDQSRRGLAELAGTSSAP